MTELEAAYNLGVADATEALRIAARAVTSNHALDSDALLVVADTIDGLKIGDDPEPSPVEPWPLAPATAEAS